MNGWIKLHRQIINKAWANKPDYMALWIHLLMEATHDEREYFWNGNKLILKPGQFITGRAKLSSISGVQQSKVERILNYFETEQQIEQQKTNTSRLISIVNWNKYQLTEQPFEQQMNNKRTTDEQQMNTKQERKELKNNITNNKLFVRPQLSEIENYIFQHYTELTTQQAKETAASFFDYFEANGWLVGKAKAKMKDWSAAVRNWIRNEKKFNQNGNKTGQTARIGTVAKSDMEEFLRRPPITNTN